MGGPPDVPLIPMPAWAVALCQSVRGAAAAVLGGGAPVDPPPPPPFPRGTDANPLTMDEVKALFDDLAAQPHIPFAFSKEFCSARAHEMRRLMAERGIESRKVFNEATLSKDLQITYDVVVRSREFGFIEWQYHVAPHVAVRTPEGVVRMVIDPSLFVAPVTIEEWLSVQQCAQPKVTDTPGSTFQPGEGRDDDYRETRKLLAEARIVAEVWERTKAEERERMQRPEWEDGIQPTDESVEDDAIVPGEGSADDDDDIEQTA